MHLRSSKGRGSCRLCSVCKAKSARAARYPSSRNNKFASAPRPRFRNQLLQRTAFTSPPSLPLCRRESADCCSRWVAMAFSGTSKASMPSARCAIPAPNDTSSLSDSSRQWRMSRSRHGLVPSVRIALPFPTVLLTDV